MLNLDNFINNYVEIVVFGKHIKVKEPTLAMFLEIDKIEKDLTIENLHEKRLEVGLLMINHNADGERFTKDQLLQLPFEALNEFIEMVANMRYTADNNPN